MSEVAQPDSMGAGADLNREGFSLRSSSVLVVVSLAGTIT